ncbi:MAG: hypothetical protein JWR16_315 [Nevskia sp.]|nr:hypothetical protein [Nevskia sp.]
MKARTVRRCCRPGALAAGALSIAGFVFAGVTSAAPLPPSDPWNELPVATLATQPVSALQLGRIKIWLEFNTLADVIKVAGANPIAHFEDDEASYDWLCYDADAHRQRLWFVSDTDMGGEQRMVTSIVAMLVEAPSDPSAACPLLPKALSSVALDRAIWLGTRDGELAKKLGEPSSSLRDWQSFYSNHRMLAPRKTPNEEGAMDDDVDESSYLNVRLVDGRVVQLVACKLTGG